MIVRDEIR